MQENILRSERFTFICSPLDRHLLAAVASQLKRSQGDAIRILIYRAADDLGISDDQMSSNESLSQWGK